MFEGDADPSCRWVGRSVLFHRWVISSMNVRSAPRLAIGPHNTAGQAFQWAEACRTYEKLEAISFAGSRRNARRITGPSHRRALHHRVRPTVLKVTWARLLLSNSTHLLNESFSTITGDLRADSLNRDLPWLDEAGIAVGIVFHGSDIRSPNRHLDSQPSSFFRLMEPEMVHSLEAKTSRESQPRPSVRLTALCQHAGSPAGSP